MIVDGGAGRHQRVDIRDCDHDLDDSVGERFGDGELIEIARVVVVDGRPEQGAQVADRRTGLRVGLGDRLRLSLCFRREVGQQPVLDHGLSRDGGEVVHSQW